MRETLMVNFFSAVFFRFRIIFIYLKGAMLAIADICVAQHMLISEPELVADPVASVRRVSIRARLVHKRKFSGVLSATFMCQLFSWCDGLRLLERHAQCNVGRDIFFCSQ